MSFPFVRIRRSAARVSSFALTRVRGQFFFSGAAELVLTANGMSAASRLTKELRPLMPSGLKSGELVRDAS